MSGPTEPSPARTSLVFPILLGIVLAASMITLFVTLFRTHRQGRAVFQAYVGTIRAGGHVSPAVGGNEATALEGKLRSALSVSVGNFEAQHGTSCYSATLHGEGAKTDVTFVLGDDDSRVIAISSERSCECPEDPNEPCRMVR